ncbi:TRAP transporter substrate-binding protein [Alkalihalobacillus oceani]|uniref:TRAP transporter substrate-binding protein n=1 Tax=Halalkalibacter oceani TaxID=1653776 RepID=UPI00203E858A|nr:TRAP transporter substrate-binding protein [Halalkalibacter oceani]MCM3759871.1 TRAP transporter substrate-binding protein [Halalkalibacter oceani]
MNRKWKCLFYSLVISFLIVVVAACGDGSATSGSTTGSQTTGEEVELSVSTYLTAGHGQVTDVLEPFFNEIEEKTEGRVTANYYPSNALGAADAQYDMAVTGVADFVLSNHGYSPGQFQLTSIADLPFMGNSAEDASRILWNLHEQFPGIAEEHEGTKIGWLFKTDTYQIFTSDKPVRTPEDLKGLRIRTPSPAGNRLLELVGATPVNIPMGDVYEGMQRGVIDGALAPASVIVNFQLSDVTKYITKGDFWTQSFYGVFNPDTWERLSAEDQEIIESMIGEQMAIKAGQVYDQDGQNGWEKAEEDGVEIIELSNEEKTEWEEALKPMVQEWIDETESKGLPGQEIYDAAIELRNP